MNGEELNMDFLIGIAALIIALSFAGLVVFLARVLKQVEEVLSHTANTVENMEQQIGEITSETKLTLYNTNETIADVNHKLTQLDPLFHAVNNVGVTANKLTSSLVKMTTRATDEVDKGAAKMDEKDLRGWMKTAAFIYYLTTTKRKEKKAAPNKEPVKSELQREHMNV